MKRLHTIAAYLVALALTGAVTLNSEQAGKMSGKATVRAVNGNASYNAGEGPMTLKPNMQLDPGTTITTGPDSVVYLSVNGLSSSVRVQAGTTMSIPQMDRIGSGREGDTETTLDLKLGSILGQVKKVSGNSRYEIKTPHGVAGIRGTDFEVTVQQLPDGKFLVTFTSVQGTVIVSAVVAGEIQTRTLRTGDSWTPGEGEPRPTAADLLQDYSNLINQMILTIQGGGPTTITIPIVPVYPTGNPPNGGAASGNGTPTSNGNSGGNGGGNGGGDEE